MNYNRNMLKIADLDFMSLKEKRKMPGVPNGTIYQVEEEQHAEHHGPELQRTGR